MTAGITGATQVYLHLAHPSAHARTPQVMNAEFARRGVDAVAVSADVAPGDLGEFARSLRGWRNLAGLSVTMPHKEALAAHVDELAGPTALIGAVNVVRRESDGRLVAANTDGQGFVIRLREAGAVFHDHEGFSTARTKSFAIMGCEGERVGWGIRLRLHDFICVTAASCFACESSGGVISSVYVEDPGSTEDVPNSWGTGSSVDAISSTQVRGCAVFRAGLAGRDDGDVGGGDFAACVVEVADVHRAVGAAHSAEHAGALRAGQVLVAPLL